jgi:hypothetical protein
VKTVIDDANAAAVMTTLGITAFMQGMVDDANLADWLTTMGLDADLATLALPANLTISAFIATVLDDAAAANARTTGGMVKDWTYTAQTATTSGTTVELTTAIPSDCLEFEVMMLGVSTSANSQPPIIELGDTDGYDTAGYSGTALYQQGTNCSETGKTDGAYCVEVGVHGGSDLIYGFWRFRRWDAAEHTWYWYARSQDSGAAWHGGGMGRHTLGAALEDVRLTTPGGSATFDAGEARVRYKN